MQFILVSCFKQTTFSKLGENVGETCWRWTPTGIWLVRYEIVQKLGRGAYGIVWKAIDKKTREALRWWDFFGLYQDVDASEFPSLEDFFWGMFFVPKENGFEVWVEVLKWDQLPISNE